MILITTYNRPRLLLRLLSQIDRQREDTVLVVDDGTPQEIEFEQYERIKVLYYRRDYNKGKKKYYQTVTEGFQQLRQIRFDDFWMLPDDVMISDNFFERSLELWDRIADPQKICLSTGHTFGRHLRGCWTNQKPVVMDDVVFTQWNDLCFYSKRQLLEEIFFETSVTHDRWAGNEELGSGVGADISRRLFKKGFNMYHVMESLVTFDNVPSQMFNEAT